MRLFDRVFQSKKTVASWPTTQGEVGEIDLQPDPLAVEIVYSYCANGEYYSGVFTKKFPPFSRQAVADAYIARFENLSKVLVHYDPDKPENSTLIEDELAPSS